MFNDPLGNVWLWIGASAFSTLFSVEEAEGGKGRGHILRRDYYGRRVVDHVLGGITVQSSSGWYEVWRLVEVICDKHLGYSRVHAEFTLKINKTLHQNVIL